MKRLDAFEWYNVTEVFPESTMYLDRDKVIGSLVKLGSGGNIQRPRYNLSIPPAVRHAHVIFLNGPMRHEDHLLTFFLARKQDRREICKCSAYPFPHKQGGGKCKATEFDHFCDSCGGPCHPISAIGAMMPGEPMPPGNVMSSCCHARVWMDGARTRPFEPEYIK